MFHNTATVATQMFTVGALPPGQGTFNPTFDPAKLKSLVARLPDKHVDLAYTTDDPVNAQVADLVAQDLDAAGLKVTTRGVTEATTFAWPTHPAGRANMLILPANPDDADASAWATLFYAQGGGLSYFEPGVTAADQAINAGLHSVPKPRPSVRLRKSGEPLPRVGRLHPAGRRAGGGGRPERYNWLVARLLDAVDRPAMGPQGEMTTDAAFQSAGGWRVIRRTMSPVLRGASLRVIGRDQRAGYLRSERGEEPARPVAGAGDPLVEIDDLTVTFRRGDGPFPALRHVSLEIGRGEILGIVGESGSGKTVLGLSMLGLLRAKPAPAGRGSGARARARHGRDPGVGAAASCEVPRSGRSSRTR